MLDICLLFSHTGHRKKRFVISLKIHSKTAPSYFVRGLSPVLLIALFIGFTGIAKAASVSVGITPENFVLLTSRLAFDKKDPARVHPDDCPGLQSDKLNDAGRALVEFVIICNAIFDSKIADRIQLVHHLPHRRRLNEVAAGKIDVSGSTIFPEAAQTLAVQSPPLISDAAIRVNEFEKAIFTVPGRDDVLAVRSLEALRKFKAVIVKYWVVDVKTLNAMKLKAVVKVTKPDLYARFMEDGRADFVISEFNTATNRPWGKKMVRVPGVKISLISPRIFLVSPQRSDILQAINTYLEKSRAGENDLIKSAFRKAAFFKPEFSNWKLLFPVN
jgi:hypothetical protein